MCTGNIIDFGQKNINEFIVKEKYILDVGAYDVNGSLKETIMAFKPKMYVGVDIRPGPNVDVVCDICRLNDLFDPKSYDLVVCTEVLEHVKDWVLAINNLKQVVKLGGHLLITVPTIGFPFHEYPSDYWRFTLDNFRQIFADFEWRAWKEYDKHSESPQIGIFLYKPVDYKNIPISALHIKEVICPVDPI